MENTPKVRGRGAPINPAGRFEKLTTLETFDDREEEDLAPERRLATTVYKDTSKTIISTNDSPDVCMDATVNPYRGCEHGCIYCYARPTHEYFGLSAGLDFETKIFAKLDAADLLRQKLQSKNWQPQTVVFSGVTDCYQPLERTMKITQACFRVLADFRNPGAIITKNALVVRDIDIFKEMKAYDGIGISISITTLDPKVARAMEPRASAPVQRLKAVEALAKAGIPVGIMIGPVLPGLTDHEIPKIMEAAANAGARSAGYTMLRLPYGVKDLFQAWLQEHFPDRADKVISRVREVRGGKLYDAEFGARMRGTGEYADHVENLFAHSKKRYGLDKRRTTLSTASFRRVLDSRQGVLF